MSTMTMTLIILAGAIVTYLTRIGGHLILSRFHHVHFRVEAALNSVPAAVLVTLVAPAALTNSWMEFVTLLFSGLIAMRFSMIPMLLAGMSLIILLRYFVSV